MGAALLLSRLPLHGTCGCGRLPSHHNHKPDYRQPPKQVTDHRIDGMNMVVGQLHHEYALVNTCGIHGSHASAVWVDGERDSLARKPENGNAVFYGTEWCHLRMCHDVFSSWLKAGVQEDVNAFLAHLPDDVWEIEVAADHASQLAVGCVYRWDLKVVHLKRRAAILELVHHNLAAWIDNFKPILAFGA